MRTVPNSGHDNLSTGKRFRESLPETGHGHLHRPHLINQDQASIVLDGFSKSFHSHSFHILRYHSVPANPLTSLSHPSQPALLSRGQVVNLEPRPLTSTPNLLSNNPRHGQPLLRIV